MKQDITQFLKNVSMERVDEALQKATHTKDLAEHVQFILSLPDDLKVFFLGRGMMWTCLESEFDMEAYDIWDACSFYQGILNTALDDPNNSGFEYYK